MIKIKEEVDLNNLLCYNFKKKGACYIHEIHFTPKLSSPSTYDNLCRLFVNERTREIYSQCIGVDPEVMYLMHEAGNMSICMWHLQLLNELNKLDIIEAQEEN